MGLGYDDYVGHDAVGLAALVRDRQVSALEVVEAAIARAEAVNPRINAIAKPLFDRAISAAATPTPGGLSGVPYAVKDIYHTIEGVELTNGSRAFVGNIARRDSELVQRFRRAGLNIFCTSTTPELAITGTTESTLYGQTRNPWNLERTSGGSSGGASALVSAGVLPAAHATDGGGSIRGPASCCGLFGMKVSRGRVPIGAGRTEGWLGYSVSHAVTRSVRDSAVLLDATHGPEPGSRYVAPPPVGTFADAVKRPPPRLRIALQKQPYSGVRIAPECVTAVERAARLCESLGHIVEEARPEVDAEALARAIGYVVRAFSAATMFGRAAQLGVDVADLEMEQVTRAFVDTAPQISALDMIAGNDACMTAAIAVSQFQQTYDVILTPTMGAPPVPLGTVALNQSLEDFIKSVSAIGAFTPLQNQTGQPAMNVPLHWSDDGLPVGVQFAGRVGEEALLFCLAAQLEAAQPWFDKLPGASPK